jgi:mRNA interferase MazF
MTRGEIWWVDLGIPFGSEPRYRRPVLIMQNKIYP